MAEPAGRAIIVIHEHPVTSEGLASRLSQFEKGDLADEVADQLGIAPGLIDGVLATIWNAAASCRKRLMPSLRERQLMSLVARGLTKNSAWYKPYVAITRS